MTRNKLPTDVPVDVSHLSLSVQGANKACHFFPVKAAEGSLRECTILLSGFKAKVISGTSDPLATWKAVFASRVSGYAREKGTTPLQEV
jgi:hypothetical protein